MRQQLMDYSGAQEKICLKNDYIDPALYDDYNVNLGLRDQNGKGVLTGLTNISKIIGSREEAGKQVPCEGELWYRGYPVQSLIRAIGREKMGFERVAYLLLMGEMPSEEAEREFSGWIGRCRRLPTNFTRDVIMKAPTEDIMNTITRSILTLAAYDPRAKDTSVANSLCQSIQLVSEFPLLAVYAYHAYNHYEKGGSMFIHNPDPELSTAENLLRMLRPDQKYSDIEAKVLDTALILHMEHGGGNNSTFTTRVVTSSGSDTYSTIAAAMSSLKGPKHGGANIKVSEMMSDIREHVTDYSDKEKLRDYLARILEKQAFDGAGLIYGMGHAVYSLSDPRERIFKEYVKRLSVAKGREADMVLYQNVEDIAMDLICEKRSIYEGVSPNIDFYSGFVYDMLGIPKELYTAMFAVARIVGWSAHRLEELICMNKIIRPAYKSVMEEREKNGV